MHTCMPPAGFEPTTVASGEWQQTDALDRAAAGIGVCVCVCVYVCMYTLWEIQSRWCIVCSRCFHGLDVFYRVHMFM